jgi:hypothetical protein
MDWLHVYIAGAAFSVFALVALVLLVSFQPVKIDLNHGVFTYLKFIWASFLKPHDRQAEDQQDALESFYKTQVRCKVNVSSSEQIITVLFSFRPASTMLLDVAFFVAVKTCWVSLRRN